MAQLPGETVCQFLKSLIIDLPFDPAIPHMCIYPREMKTRPHENWYTNIHSGIIHNSQKGETPKHLPNESQVWYIHTGEYYSPVFKNEVRSHTCYNVGKSRKHKCK